MPPKTSLRGVDFDNIDRLTKKAKTYEIVPPTTRRKHERIIRQWEEFMSNYDITGNDAWKNENVTLDKVKAYIIARAESARSPGGDPIAFQTLSDERTVLMKFVSIINSRKYNVSENN